MLINDLVSELASLPRPAQVSRLREIVPSLSLADRFALLHELGIYAHEESLSGEGSSLRETQALRAALPELLSRFAVRTLVDVPCGDFYWLSRVPLEGVGYIGCDIVPELVASNELRYGTPRRRFFVADATRDPLPKGDLVVCRDLLIHLSLTDMRAALENFARSGARLLLTNHYAHCDHNAEILSGDFRPVNLCRPPYELPGPLCTIAEDSAMEGGRYSDRAMALWELTTVEASLRRLASDPVP